MNHVGCALLLRHLRDQPKQVCGQGRAAERRHHRSWQCHIQGKVNNSGSIIIYEVASNGTIQLPLHKCTSAKAFSYEHRPLQAVEKPFRSSSSSYNHLLIKAEQFSQLCVCIIAVRQLPLIWSFFPNMSAGREALFCLDEKGRALTRVW